MFNICFDIHFFLRLPRFRIMHWGSSYTKTSSQSLLNFLNHLHQTERFEDIKSTLNTGLSEPVSRKEILDAILALPQSESLTADGLTVHFYKRYACKIIGLLQAFFNQIFDLKPIKQTVFESLSQGKNDHNYSYDIQYRFSPITMFNVDYNILALILAERLKSVLEHILNPGSNQTTHFCSRPHHWSNPSAVYFIKTRSRYTEMAIFV